MSTLEKLFMHVFERRNCILDQFKSQKKSYDQCLASCLLINGINPPSWLHDAELAPQTADLKELKRELTTNTSLPHPSALPHIEANSVPSTSELYDSLSRFQRSRSRQKALELRSNAKPKRNSCPHGETIQHGETIPQKYADRATSSSGSQKTYNVSEMPESKKLADTIDAAVLSEPGLPHLNFRCTDESYDLVTFNDHGGGDCLQNTADISNEQSECILEKEIIIQNVVNNPIESADWSADDRVPGTPAFEDNMASDPPRFLHAFVNLHDIDDAGKCSPNSCRSHDGMAVRRLHHAQNMKNIRHQKAPCFTYPQTRARGNVLMKSFNMLDTDISSANAKHEVNSSAFVKLHDSDDVEKCSPKSCHSYDEMVVRRLHHPRNMNNIIHQKPPCFTYPQARARRDGLVKSLNMLDTVLSSMNVNCEVNANAFVKLHDFADAEQCCPNPCLSQDETVVRRLDRAPNMKNIIHQKAPCFTHPQTCARGNGVMRSLSLPDTVLSLVKVNHEVNSNASVKLHDFDDVEKCSPNSCRSHDEMVVRRLHHPHNMKNFIHQKAPCFTYPQTRACGSGLVKTLNMLDTAISSVNSKHEVNNLNKNDSQSYVNEKLNTNTGVGDVANAELALNKETVTYDTAVSHVDPQVYNDGFLRNELVYAPYYAPTAPGLVLELPRTSPLFGTKQLDFLDKASSTLNSQGVHIFEGSTEDGSIASTVPGIEVGIDSSEKAVAHEPRDASTPCILDITTLSHSDIVHTSPRGIWSSVDKKEAEGKSLQYEDALHSYASAFMSAEDSATGTDTNLPELEGFCLSVSPEHEPPLIAGDGIGLDNLDFSVTRNSEHVLEQLCRYTNLSTPLPGPTLSTVKDVCYSLPTGMLEQMNMNSFILANTTDAKESISGEDVLVSDIVYGSNTELRGSLQRWPYSYTPPVEKVHLRHGHTILDKNLSMNMELTCFRIDEDACINEEDEHLHAVVGPPGIAFSSRRNSSLKNSHPFVEIFECNEEGKLQDRDSSASVNLDHNFQGRQERAKKLENGSCQTHKCNVGKENSGFMGDDSAVEHSHESLLKKPCKPKYPAKRSEDSHSHGSVDKVRRITNTMSNVTSFVPLVQQKQKPPQVMTGKRDIKVRALEAAEAAKRLEVDRENARKMRKEAAAAKVEKNKLAHEHLRRQGVEQRKKEGEKKKKEASLVKRKRQREDEERKEKEKKCRCLGEARKQQQEHERKLYAEKEDKHRRIVEDVKKRQKLDSGREITSSVETDSSKFMHFNIKQLSASCESNSVLEVPGYIEAAVSNLVNLHNLNSDDLLLVDGRSEPQSYELSPYQPSEDEGDEEEEDELCKKKYIPQWAREKCVNATLELFRNYDPNTVFLPERSFIISEIDLG